MKAYIFDPESLAAGTSIELERMCPVCRTTVAVVVDSDRYNRWQSGEFIQNVWPHVVPSEREILKTGIDGACFEIIMSDDQ